MRLALRLRTPTLISYPLPVSAGTDRGHLAAADRGESALGYRIGREVVLNPPKATPLRLTADDQVLVLGPRAVRPAPAPALESINSAAG